MMIEEREYRDLVTRLTAFGESIGLDYITDTGVDAENINQALTSDTPEYWVAMQRVAVNAAQCRIEDAGLDLGDFEQIFLK